MLLVFAMAAMLWGVGHVMGAPRQARFLMLALLYVGVLILQVLLPAGHPLRMATGESPALWLLLGAFVALVLIYRQGLGWLRGQAQAKEAAAAPAAPQRTGAFSETELNRYARHIVLRELGGAGQKKLKEAKVLVTILKAADAKNVATSGDISALEHAIINVNRETLSLRAEFYKVVAAQTLVIVGAVTALLQVL